MWSITTAQEAEILRRYNDNPNRDPNIWWHRTLWEDLDNNREWLFLGVFFCLTVALAVAL